MPMKPESYRAYPPQPPAPRKPDTRPPAYIRGYDADWYRLRAWFIAKHPVCQWPSCMQEGREVDHIIPVRVAPEKRLDADNLQTLCRSHHRVKTAKDKDRFK